MTQDRNTRTITDFHLEQYALGELPEAESRALEKRLAADAALRRRLDALERQDRAFASRFPAEAMVPAIEAAAKPARARERRPDPEPRRTESPLRRFLDSLPRSRGWQAAGLFALLTLVLVPVSLLREPPTASAEGDRLKGKTAELRLYRNTPGGPQRVDSGASASAGDVIQVEFHPGGFAHGAIVSVDGNGTVTVHWPQPPGSGTALSALPGHRLPEAFRLDDAPGFERFHLLLSGSPIDVAGLKPLIAASARQDEAWLAGRLPASLQAVAFTLRKGP